MTQKILALVVALAFAQFAVAQESAVETVTQSNSVLTGTQESVVESSPSDIPVSQMQDGPSAAAIISPQPEMNMPPAPMAEGQMIHGNGQIIHSQHAVSGDCGCGTSYVAPSVGYAAPSSGYVSSGCGNCNQVVTGYATPSCGSTYVGTSYCAPQNNCNSCNRRPVIMRRCPPRVFLGRRCR